MAINRKSLLILALVDKFCLATAAASKSHLTLLILSHLRGCSQTSTMISPLALNSDFTKPTVCAQALHSDPVEARALSEDPCHGR